MLLFAGLTFLIAGGITALELVTAEYHNTAFFLCKCPAFYLYVFAYGLIAAIVFWQLDQLNQANEFIRLEALGVDTMLGEAVCVGVSIRSLLNIRFAQVRIGPYSLPFGLATLVMPLETWLREKKLALQEWNAVRSFVDHRVEKYGDIEIVRSKIKQNIPPPLTEEESKALTLDVEEQLATVPEIMERYLRKAGRRTFQRVFPT